ncbi:MAG: hypothetical protein ABR587_11300 [Candidatus Binatia bacterium]
MSSPSRAPRTTPVQKGPDFLELLTRQGVHDPGEAGMRRRIWLRVASVALLVSGHLWIAAVSRNLGYEREALSRLIHRLDQERVELEDAVARESRPALLASRAVEFGMQKPTHGQLRRIGAGSLGTDAKP